MAQRLVQALGRGLGKTATDGVKSAARKATRDVPSTESFYKLGMGIGPFIRNTVQSYNSNKNTGDGDSKKINASLGFAKENVVTQKNIAGQLSALTSIMSDIRKISLAQLNLQRVALRASGRGGRGFGDRSAYLSQEQSLEGKSSLSATPIGKDRNGNSQGLLGGILGFIGNNPLISAGLMGILALANAKEIDKFLEQTGIKKKLKDGTEAAITGIANLIGSTIKDAILIGLPKVYESIRKDLVQAWEDLLAGNTPGATRNLGEAAQIPGAAVGAYKGLRAGGPLGAVVGGTLGYFGPKILGDQFAELQERAAKGDKEAQRQLDMIKTGAGAAGGAYATKKLLEKVLSKSPSVTPTAPPGGAVPPAAPPSATPKGPNASGKPLTDFGEAGEKIKKAREAAERASKSIYQKATGALAKYAVDAAEMMKRCVSLVTTLTEKIGIKKVLAYLAARTGLALSGLSGGPVVIITTILVAGWTIYDVYSFLKALMDEVDKGETSGNSDKGSTPGASPAQRPAGSVPAASQGDLRKVDNAIEAKNQENVPSSPIPGKKPHSGFGMRMHPILGVMKHHNGLDYPGNVGDPVHAVMDGEVTKVGPNGGLGESITILHDDGTSSVYGHLSDIGVSAGKKVKKGEQIGKVGNTGQSKGPHLHLEIHQNGKAIDPKEYFNRSKNKTGTDGNNQSKVSGAETSAPGPSNAGQAFASAFGFDPSRMGMDVESMLTGDQLAKLNSVHQDITGARTLFSDTMNKIHNVNPSKGPSNPGAAPAPQKKVDVAQAREKDQLWPHYNPILT